LSRVSALKLISRTSVMEYRDLRENIRTVGQELGATYVVEGEVQRAGDLVMVTAQLIDARTDAHIWGETYERELTVENLFAIQRELATGIAEALRVRLLPEEAAQLSDRPTDNLEAYEAYVLAGAMVYELTRLGPTLEPGGPPVPLRDALLTWALSPSAAGVTGASSRDRWSDVSVVVV
jgi:hypothetical protein